MAGLKFRVLLDSKDKNEVFRDILISDKDNFESFYKEILNAYNFYSDQMASFYMSNERWDKGFEISLFDLSSGEDSSQILPGIMNKSIIEEFIKESNQKIILVHDFLRMWIFLIELIDYQEETPDSVQTVLAVGEAPSEESRSNENNSLQFKTDSEFDNQDEDEFGFNDYEDQYEY